MLAHEPNTRNGKRKGNGRTPAENRAYAQIAQAGLRRDQQLANAAAGREGRRQKIRDDLDPGRKLDPGVLR